MRPKRTVVCHREVITYTSEYYCPKCRTQFFGADIGRDVTRFICRCGQELIVEKRVIERLKEG